MTATMADDSGRRTRGIALMTAAMLTIPLVDGLAKYLSADYSPLFLSWMRYAVASAIVLPLAAARHGRHLFPSTQLPSHVLRTLFLVAAMTLYFLAIARIPLATAVSAYFVGPIIAVVLAVVLLKERLTVRKGVSLALGFAGSLVIVRPGGAIEPGLLLALGAGACFACYLVATRRASADSDPIRTLAFQCVVGVALLTPQAVYAWSTPAWSDLAFFAALGACSAITHLLSIAAFRLADATTLAPLVYIELVGAALIGYFAFGDVPNTATAIGAACIVAGGCVLLARPASARA
jgi:drug/metabolite transporter (DMT)-like permease